MRRVPLSVLLLVFALIGLTAGLSYAWLIAPGAEANQTPAQLNAADRDAYLRLMADSFATTGDRAAAARRMAALGPDGERALLDLLDAGLRSGTPGDRRLAAMAGALGIDSPTIALLAPPGPLPPATAAPSSTPTAAPTTAAAGRFTLVAREPVCQAVGADDGGAVHRLEFAVRDEAGEPLAGVGITVQWPGGEDTFVTGFKAEGDAGYADFDMAPEIVYAVAVGGEAPSADDLQVALCPDGQDGGWRLEYEAQAP